MLLRLDSGKGMKQKKAVDGLAGVWTLGVSIGATRLPARLGMAHAIDFPIVLDFVIVGVIPVIGHIAAPTWYLPLCCRGRSGKIGIVGAMRGQHIRIHPLLYCLIAIDDVDDIVVGTMKYNGWNCGLAHVGGSRSRATTIAHGGEGGRNVARGTAS